MVVESIQKNPFDISVMKSPVAFIIFKRPELASKVFTEIQKAKPPILLVVADGPRDGFVDDEELVRKSRAVIDKVDWPCKVLKNYAETNMGLAERVSTGLNWVFEQADRAIILEDDCLPDPTFFRYCDELLEEYSDDQRVMAISGDNFQEGRERTEYSYYFSRYNHCWGWASWRRAWQYYDHEMIHWPELKSRGWLIDLFEGDKAAVRYWTNIFDRVMEGRIDSWAYRWKFSCWAQSGLTILPNQNLVSNIGFNERGTNTSTKNRSANVPRVSLNFPLKHPRFIVRDREADLYTQKIHYGTSTKMSLKRNAVNLLRRSGLLSL